MGEGLEIKVKPEQLEQIAKNISEMQTHSQNIQQNLNQSMFSIQMQWQGSTSQRFYGEFMRSTKLMEAYIRNLQVTEKELRRIAQKFRQADEEYQKKQNEKLKETHKKEKKHEKSWWEKGVEGAAEFIGVNDAIRAVTGKDPITGKELSSKERLIAAGWTLLNFVPVGKVASLAGKGIKYVASSFGKTIVKAGKRLGEGVTMVAGKAGKAAVDGIKTASHKVTEGVNFVASTAKGFADKIGSLWNKGATTVKTSFLQGNEKIQHAVKTLLEYKWIPGLGKGFAIAGVGKVSGGGQYSLKEAYQYMESKVVKGTGKDTLEVKFTKEQLATKPSYSPVPEKWMKKGGTVKIDEDGTWVYTNKKGQTVRYPDGYPDFTEYAHPTVKPVEIEIASPTNRPSDYKNANIEAGLNKNSDPPVPALDKPPVGYIWHHHQDGKTMILVDKDIHREFTHAGGVSTVNGK